MSFVWFAVVLFSVVQRCFCSQQPNIVFILADDLGYDDIGINTNDILTPNIDSLFNKGIKLTNYYVQATCSPTRGALMTGRYPLHNGLICVILGLQATGLPLSEITMADVLLANNYSTHIVGKWHMGFYKWEYTPTFRGFESFYGYYQGSEDYYTHISSSAYDLHEENGLKCSYNCSKIVTQAYGNYSAFLFTNRAIDIIKNHTKNENTQNKPLFLYLPYQSVHSPAQVPSYYKDKYKKTINDTERRTFAGMVTCLDEGIGNVTNALKENGIYNNTIIIFSSDNGAPVDGCGGPIGGSNVPHRGGKHSIWEGGTNVVGAIHIPPSLLLQDKSKLNFDNNNMYLTYDNLLHVVDWMPTLLTAANIDVTKLNIEFDGINLWNGLLNTANGIKNDENVTIRNELYYGTNNPCSDHWIVNNTGIRVGNMKYLNTSGGAPRGWYPPPGTGKTQNSIINNDASFISYKDGIHGQLFNLSNDRNETTDISSLYPDITQQLMTKMSDIEQTGNPMAITNPNCSNITLPSDPTVGLYWIPWCSPHEP